jgi:hypothetical protein
MCWRAGWLVCGSEGTATSAAAQGLSAAQKPARGDCLLQGMRDVHRYQIDLLLDTSTSSSRRVCSFGEQLLGPLVTLGICILWLLVWAQLVHGLVHAFMQAAHTAAKAGCTYSS